MHRRISTILHRLRQDVAATLGDDVIRDACLAAGHTWSDSALLTPIATRAEKRGRGRRKGVGDNYQDKLSPSPFLRPR